MGGIDCSSFMKTSFLLLALPLYFGALIGWPLTLRADGTNAPGHQKIYDESADGKKQVADAATIAKTEHKHILLLFGENSCVGCIALHGILTSNKSVNDELGTNYVLAMIDESGEHNRNVVKEYGADQYGMPLLAVLDSDGKLLKKEDAGPLSEGHKDTNTGAIFVTIVPERVLDFLDTWKPGGVASTPVNFAPNPAVTFVSVVTLGGGLKQAQFEAHNSSQSEIVCRVEVEQRAGSSTQTFSIPPNASAPFSFFVRAGDKPEIKAEVMRLMPVSRFKVPMPDGVSGP
jgi:protein disulfide-isomerase